MTQINNEPRTSGAVDSAAAAPSDLGTGSWKSTAGSKMASVMGSVPGPLIGLIIIFIALSFLSPFFLTPRNLLNILSQVSAIGVMSVGAVLIIIIGGIDLSVGSVVALSSMSMAWLFRVAELPFEIALVGGLVVGALIGLINGLLTAYGKLQPFIATLATMSAAAGLALFLTNGNPVNGFPQWFLAITSTSFIGIPIQGIVLILIFAITAFWLRYRPSGRALYAIGGNEEVARLSGLPIRRAKIAVYVIAGILAAIAGLLVTSRLDSAQPTAGVADLLNVIAVVVIGGASLSGGSGSMLGTFVGLLIIGVLNNGMSLLNVSPNLQPVVVGFVIVAAVMTDRRTSRKKS
ncbi:ABC transporter permease [Cryobacterium levicorallinum]|uniref:ABC transporter permease n=2 Tax=Microbacteriaceae TaxID=85023 RepID=A0A1I2Y6S8_9MICO|nr:ABC transporter permease [Cryobacterium levicorallinum]GEP27425.1 ribose ABC transporter permease [Cryobacterium levicorallinum]SFH20666.1 ribose transport system permease protein [Cryobacterium levicorallinum]